jgi:hypothetical protein
MSSSPPLDDDTRDQPPSDEAAVGNAAVDGASPENDQNPQTVDLTLVESDSPKSAPGASEAVSEPKKRKRAPPKPKQAVKTSDPNVEIEIRSHKPGPTKRRIVVYKEDLPQDEIVIVEKSRKRGRPVTKVPKIVREPESKQELTQQGPDKIEFQRPTQEKELTAKQLKHLELVERFATLEQAAGRKLRMTVKGKADGRCIGQRTPKQIEAAKRLVQASAERRAQKMQDTKIATASTVRQVIGELSAAARSVPEPLVLEPVAPEPAPLRTRDLFSN